MNAERLKGVVDFLLARERKINIQQALQAFVSALNNLVGSPTHPPYQTEVAERLTELDNGVRKFYNQLTPAEIKSIEGIGGLPFFSSELVDTLKDAVAQNAMTPAVVQQRTNELIGKRQAFLETLTNTSNSLTQLGINSDSLEEGEAEIGFQIPRDIFENELDGLIGELRAIRRIIRAFSELATGSVEPIEVRQISTSDPFFFFGLDVATVTQLGLVVVWALDRWKQVEEIRKLRSETRKNKSFSEEEIKTFFDKKIEDTVKAAIDQKTTELVGPADGKAGRKEEQRADISWALESLLARIERGMTVEVRFLPPTASATDESGGASGQTEDFQTLSELAPQLVFPAADAAPVLAIPRAEPEKSPRKAKAAE
ncbi:hypothetical protein [Microvirga sesbaniae]|uniref:hypothetical protein n=1 Tax=Microvirga sesbaniae TaxID=681392 RepID=UPI0021C6E06F|nr:hypothetical protein [Microvirga sp. HBU67692]